MIIPCLAALQDFIIKSKISVNYFLIPENFQKCWYVDVNKHLAAGIYTNAGRHAGVHCDITNGWLPGGLEVIICKWSAAKWIQSRSLKSKNQSGSVARAEKV